MGGSDLIHIPAVYRACTTRKVLVTEWIDGVQVRACTRYLVDTRENSGMHTGM